MFVDYSGKRPSLVDATTGELMPVELFVGVTMRVGAAQRLSAGLAVGKSACPSSCRAPWFAARAA
jgi:hypothetical protein